MLTKRMPTTIEELIIGIEVFWRDVVTVEYCNSKIDHLQNFLPKVIQYNGKATEMLFHFNRIKYLRFWVSKVSVKSRLSSKFDMHT